MKGGNNQEPNIVLNLDGLEKDQNRGDIFKIEENGSFDNKISFKSSTDSDDDDLG